MIIIIATVVIIIVIIMIIIIIIITITIIILNFVITITCAGHVDQYALALLQKIKEDSSSTSVVLITHRTNEMFHSLMSVIENIIPRNQTTYMFLGEHTHNTAKKIVSEYDSDSSIPEIIGNSGKLEISVKSNFTNSGIMDFEGVKIVTVGDPRSFDLSHFYPVVPKEYFMRSKKSLKMREIIENKFKNDNDNNENNESNSESVNNDNKNDIDSNSNSDGNDSNSEIKINLRTKNQSHQNNDLNDKYSRLKDYQMNLLQTALVKLEKTENEREKKTYHPLFVVQGNFGGKHSHRKDPVGTLNCLRKLEDKLELESVVKQKELKKERRREKLLRNRLNHMRRKTMEENSDFNNTIKFEKINNVRKPKSTESEANDNKPILSINDGNDSCFSPLESSLKSISIDLVGHLNGKVEVGILKTGKVRFLSDLGSKDYYEAISKVKKMKIIYDYLSPKSYILIYSFIS